MCSHEKLGEKVYNPYSKMVFRSSKDATVIGKFDIKNGEILPLTKEDIEKCVKLNYTFEEEEKENEDDIKEDTDDEMSSDDDNNKIILLMKMIMKMMISKKKINYNKHNYIYKYF